MGTTSFPHSLTPITPIIIIIILLIIINNTINITLSTAFTVFSGWCEHCEPPLSDRPVRTGSAANLVLSPPPAEGGAVGERTGGRRAGWGHFAAWG